jgi:diguanylate cyclase (GGDEF)-like protein/PAS domain S-box-containing protein
MGKKASSEREAARAGIRSSIAEPREQTSRTTSLSELREHAAGLRRAQVMANLAHVVTKPDGSFETWSETLPALLGLEGKEIVDSTRRWLDLIHPADRGRFRATALQARADGLRREVEYRLWRNDSSWVHVRQVMEPIPGNADSQGRLRWFNTLQDVTQQVRAQERINRLNRVYAVLSGINGAIVRIRERQKILETACRIAVEAGGFVMAWIGIVDRNAALVRPEASAGDVGNFFDHAPLAILETTPGGRGLAGKAVRSKRPVISNDVKNDSQRLMRKELDERGIHSVALLPLIVDDEAVGVLALYAADAGFFDAEEMRLLEELAGDVAFALDHIEKSRRLEYVSYYDPLTGLPNRTLFHDRLRVQLQDAERKGERVALKILDIERFKTINDSLGRQAGDALLGEVVKRIQNLRPEGTWLARLGADQFAIVTPGVPAERELSLVTDQRLAQTFVAPFSIAGAELRIAARVGIAVFPADAADCEALLRNAEAALKRAKATGERFLFYAQEMTERVAEKLSLENQLRRALEREEFVLHYQPKVDARTSKIVGVEALIRWQSPELGLVAPMKFIPLLEETGLILEVGAWALACAVRQHRDWHAAGVAVPRIAVNVSAIQLRQREFVRTVEQAIAQGLSPVGIDLEITESVVMEDIQATIAKLTAVRELGIGIAVDDFGTGYSSLAYLARLPVQLLKVDRSFVKSMDGDATAMNIIRTIISLAHSLGLAVVAEGVETDRQVALLQKLGCDQLQGYLFSKPLPAEGLAQLLTGG